jgi:hypothetical protein
MRYSTKFTVGSPLHQAISLVVADGAPFLRHYLLASSCGWCKRHGVQPNPNELILLGRIRSTAITNQLAAEDGYGCRFEMTSQAFRNG